MLLGEAEDIFVFAAGRVLRAAAGPAEFEIERRIGFERGEPVESPRRSIAASSVSCGANPTLTSLAPGGVPLL